MSRLPIVRKLVVRGHHFPRVIGASAREAQVWQRLEHAKHELRVCIRCLVKLRDT